MPTSLKVSLAKSYTGRFVAWLLWFNFIDLLACVWQQPSMRKAKKRVILQRIDGIGDYIVWTSTFRALEALYPSADYERIFVGCDVVRPLAENQPFFDRTILINQGLFVFDPKYRFQIIRQVRRLRADVLINFKLTREFLWSDSVVRCSGAPIRIGSAGLNNQMSSLSQKIGDGWYTQLIKAPVRYEHELISHKKFITAMAPRFDFELMIPGIPESQIDPASVIDGDYAIFFLGAAQANKIWPMEKFVEVANFVEKTCNLRVVLCGGRNEQGLADEFKASYSGSVIDLMGNDLLELNRLIRSAKLVLSNDTGAGHIAAVLKTPTVIITPGNQVDRFFPYPSLPVTDGIRQLSVVHEMPCFGCGYHCIYKDRPEDSPMPCVEGVSVADVTSAISELI
ncbi:hypothetical protein BH10ACI2_BH10ACI2_16480 [soil metagenome]